jgi:hypothetical protein
MAVVTQSTGGQSSAVVNGQSIDFIVQQVIQILPGCPDTFANNILQQTIREFYYRSAGWRENIGPYPINQGLDVIELNPVDQYAQCHLVLGAFLYPDTTGVLNPKSLVPMGARRYGQQPGPPTFFSMDSPTRLRLDPVPDQNYGQLLYVRMILMPVINAARLPNISITHHFDGLLYGTLYRLGMMPNKPWSVKDQNLLKEWRKLNMQGIALARDMAERGYAPVDAAMRFPNFAGSYSQNPNTAGGTTF